MHQTLSLIEIPSYRRTKFLLCSCRKVTKWSLLNSALIREEARLPAVSSALLFEIFPFIIVYDEHMTIQTIGRSLHQILPSLPGQKMNEFFDLVRPIIEFKFDIVLARSNNIFEIMTMEPIDVLLKAGGQAHAGTYFIITYSRLHISWNEVFSKILKKPSIEQK